MTSLIYVVHTEPEVCELVRASLEGAGYVANTPLKDLTSFRTPSQHHSLIVVGMEALKEHGFAVPWGDISDEFSARPQCLVVLDNNSHRDRMIALDSGGDDYIVRPFSPEELVAKVRALLRRSAASVVPINAESADIVIDSWAMKLLVRGTEVDATTLEFRLLEYLARHPRQVFTRDFLLDAVWGDMRFISPRSVDACIRRIREKIERDSAKPTMLRTVRGVGYRMDAIAAWQSAPTEVCDCPACRTRISALRFQESGPKRRRATAQG